MRLTRKDGKREGWKEREKGERERGERQKKREKFRGKKRREWKGREKRDEMQIQRQNSIETIPIGDGGENESKKEGLEEAARK